MCGIIALVWHQRERLCSHLLTGLSRLEYRGYDSAGLALLTESGELHAEKVVGRVHTLPSPTMEATMGIAHTRWATHGPATLSNAHPHLSNERLALVHNGVILNAEALRSQVLANGYALHSDTDSELIAHLLDHAVSQYATPQEAILSVMKQLEGSFACAVIDKRFPNQLMAFCHKSPLIFGRGENGSALASDLTAICDLVDDVLYLEDGEILIANLHTHTLYREGTTIPRALHPHHLSAVHIDKGTHEHFMKKEIHEQPDCFEQLLQQWVHGQEFLTLFPEQLAQHLDTAEDILILACGSSYHAALLGRFFLESRLNIPVRVEIASEYVLYPLIPRKNQLVITLSQSGETADTIAALAYAKTTQPLMTLALGNVEQSTLFRQSDLALLQHAGPEIGVASTKGFTSQVVLLDLLSLYMAHRRGTLPHATLQELLADLKKLPALTQNTLLRLQKLPTDTWTAWQKPHAALFIGRGMFYPLACEGALKLKELAYIHASAYASGELKHGPLALVEAGLPIVVLGHSQYYYEKTLLNLEELQARSGQLWLISDEGFALPEHIRARHWSLPASNAHHALILQTLALQCLTYATALHRGCNIDQPRNLAKSVTVE